MVLESLAMSASSAYLRFPSVRGAQVAFAAEDDVWLAPADGGRAWRITADDAPVAGVRLSPDGARVAFTSRRDGPPEVCVADLDGGGARRLTFWGEDTTRVLGWLDDARVVAACAVRAADRAMTWAWAVPVDGGVPERLPYGPVTGFAPGPDGALRPGRRPEPARRRVLEAVPRWGRRQALGRPDRHRDVRAPAHGARRPARGPDVGRRPARAPVRPRGLGQRLLGAAAARRRPGRARRPGRPAPAHRPRRRLRPGPGR